MAGTPSAAYISYLLRLPDEGARRTERALFVEDLKRVQSLL